VNEELTRRIVAGMPFAAELGLEALEATPDLVRARVAWAPRLTTAGGLVHGGVLMALADCCGGYCAFLNLPGDGYATATIESKTNFLRAVREGAVTATARPLHRGRQVIVVESELHDDRDRLVAKVTQTQAVLPPG
jgi:uncharacterized protein (TIGR00369 family)